MTPEMIAIIAVGVTLIGMNLHSSRETRAEMRREFGVLGERIDALGERVDALGERVDALEARVGALETRVGALGQRVARLEGLFEGVFRGKIEMSPLAAE